MSWERLEHAAREVVGRLGRGELLRFFPQLAPLIPDDDQGRRTAREWVAILRGPT